MTNQNQEDSKSSLELAQEAQQLTHQTRELSEAISEAYAAEETVQQFYDLQSTIQAQRKQISFYMVVTLVLGVLLTIMTGALASYPKTKIVAMQDTTPICEVMPQDNPNINDLSVTTFATQAVIHVNSFNFADHNEKLEWAFGQYFTERGRRLVVAGMRNNGILTDVEKGLFTVKATVDGTPSIADINSETDKKSWSVKVPIRVETFGSTIKPLETQHLVATVTVEAYSASRTNPTGLGVSNITYLRNK